MKKITRTAAALAGLLLSMTSFGVSGVAEAQNQPQNTGSCVSQSGTERRAGQSDQYPPGFAVVAVNRTEVPAGGVVEVSGCGAPNGRVNFVLFSHPKPLGSATTDGTGFYRASLTIPCDTEQGAHTLRASGAANDSTTLNVNGTTGVCASGAATTAGRDRGERLPRTGSSSTAPLAAAGAGLVLIGAATAITARRRRTAESA